MRPEGPARYSRAARSGQANGLAQGARRRTGRNAHSPGQPWKHGKQSIRTLWGELAWQLGGEEAFALLKEADANGTSPGKDVLGTLLERHAPCVVLVDELVAYIRQFPEGQVLTGGTFESNLSFIQALTEAAKLVPNSIILASLPESDPKRANPNVQVGGARGLQALNALESILGAHPSLVEAGCHRGSI